MIMPSLLGVDLGLRTGLALFGADGRLIWYRSRNFGTSTRLRQAAHGILADLPELQWLVMEGGGPIAEIWRREASRRSVQIIQIAAEQWRERFFDPRKHRNGPQAKHTADIVARQVIEWAAAKRPTSLRHDAAEAILIGLYGVIELGWLSAIPGLLVRLKAQSS
jgi:hypothetical protein